MKMERQKLIKILNKQSKEQQEAEEILDRIHNIERMSACMEDSYVLKRTAIKAMQEYAQQESKITDNMIEKPYSKGKRIQGEDDIDYYQDEDGSISYA